MKPSKPTTPRDAPPRVRCEMRYEGHVQGVGFRYTACQIAERFAVTGCVKNLPDGSVALAAEGAADEVERFLGAVAAEMGRYIRDTRRRDHEASDEFSSFEISF